MRACACKNSVLRLPFLGLVQREIKGKPTDLRNLLNPVAKNNHDVAVALHQVRLLGQFDVCFGKRYSRATLDPTSFFSFSMGTVFAFSCCGPQIRMTSIIKSAWLAMRGKFTRPTFSLSHITSPPHLRTRSRTRPFWFHAFFNPFNDAADSSSAAMASPHL